MKDKIPILYCKLKKYEKKSEGGKELVARRYMIPIKKEQIENTAFEDVEDIVVLSKKDFDHEFQKLQDASLSTDKFKMSLKEKDQVIFNLKELLKDKDQEIGYLKYLQEIEVKEFELELKKINDKYKGEIEALNIKIEQLSDIHNQYEYLKTKNKELEREFRTLDDVHLLENESFPTEFNKTESINDEYDKFKRLNDLHLLENESIRTKLNEMKLTIDEYDELKRLNDLQLLENEPLQTKPDERKSAVNEYNELKRLNDLHMLKKESIRTKLEEMELTIDEYDKLKRSHELLWDVIHKRDRVIRDLEDRGLVVNLLKKIRNGGV